MNNQLYTIKTISSLHCGIGSGQGDIDLPVAKSPVTGLPHIPSSSLKGVVKDCFFNRSDIAQNSHAQLEELFGPENSDFASAVSFGDGTLLALPVRSYFGGFAYLSSPLVLGLLRQVLLRSGLKEIPKIPEFGAHTQEQHYKASIPENSLLEGGGIQDKVLLEEIDLLIEPSYQGLTQEWAELIGKIYFSDEEYRRVFHQRFIIADDNVLQFMAQTALPVDAHIAIDDKTGVVHKGALWYEESVPPETLFYGVIGVDNGNGEAKSTEKELTQLLLDDSPTTIQIGGKATTGKGMVDFRFPSINE